MQLWVNGLNFPPRGPSKEDGGVQQWGPRQPLGVPPMPSCHRAFHLSRPQCAACKLRTIKNEVQRSWGLKAGIGASVFTWAV